MIELLHYNGEQTCDSYDRYDTHGTANWELVNVGPSRDSVLCRLCDDCARILQETLTYKRGAK